MIYPPIIVFKVSQAPVPNKRKLMAKTNRKVTIPTTTTTAIATTTTTTITTTPITTTTSGSSDNDNTNTVNYSRAYFRQLMASAESSGGRVVGVRIISKSSSSDGGNDGDHNDDYNNIDTTPSGKL